MIIEYNITDICEVWALNKDPFGFSLHQPGHILRCHKDHWPQSTSRGKVEGHNGQTGRGWDKPAFFRTVCMHSCRCAGLNGKVSESV